VCAEPTKVAKCGVAEVRLLAAAWTRGPDGGVGCEGLARRRVFAAARASSAFLGLRHFGGGASLETRAYLRLGVSEFGASLETQAYEEST
jgi:hypothetical protein